MCGQSRLAIGTPTPQPGRAPARPHTTPRKGWSIRSHPATGSCRGLPAGPGNAFNLGDLVGQLAGSRIRLIPNILFIITSSCSLVSSLCGFARLCQSVSRSLPCLQLGFVTEMPPEVTAACEAPGLVLPGGPDEGEGDNGEHFTCRLLMKQSRALVQWAIFHQACKVWLADGLKIQLNTFTDLSINIIF